LTATIGILGTGDMGSAVGRVLSAAGYRVVTALEGRSRASRRLSAAAGLVDLGSPELALGESDVFLSILPPSAAAGFAARASGLMRQDAVFADCNAVAPATVREIAGHFDGGRARFVDVGIVGPAPKPGVHGRTRFYVSGAERLAILNLAVPELEVVDIGDDIGQASAIKMCYAAMNKGVDALYTNILLAAERLGVREELMKEFAGSQGEALARMQRRLPFLAATAARFTGEMAEIAETFDAAGVSGDFHRGAEWLYARLAESSLSNETRATLPASRSLDDAIAAFAAVLEHD
jgi:3-hydroxyisobutyrate dehydrogenase-like beta-hydroxyacid dehydrogenase